MIPDRKFIRRCASQNNRYVPPELEDWILARYEDEPYPGFFDALTLEGLICGYCDAYARGTLPDLSIPDPQQRLQERYEELKDCIADLLIDIQYLEEENHRYRELLKEHHLV